MIWCAHPPYLPKAAAGKLALCEQATAEFCVNPIVEKIRRLNCISLLLCLPARMPDVILDSRKSRDSRLSRSGHRPQGKRAMGVPARLWFSGGGRRAARIPALAFIVRLPGAAR